MVERVQIVYFTLYVPKQALKQPFVEIDTNTNLVSLIGSEIILESISLQSHIKHIMLWL